VGEDEVEHDERFNPRAREGRDEASALVFFYDLAVSIHAPVKGATKFPGERQERGIPFQSTRP